MLIPDIEGLIKKEGGFVDNPMDRGGPTKYGITEKTARSNGFTGEMKNLQRSFAKEIYYKQYWIKPKFNLINKYSQELSALLFDAGVVMGVNKVSSYLQRALNVLNSNQKYYDDLIIDGLIGRQTIKAIESLSTWRGQQGLDILLDSTRVKIKNHFFTLTENDPTQEIFFFGWMRNRG